jgi:signal transduction histidine kinase
VPIVLPEVHRLQGHLFLLYQQPPTTEDKEAAADAAREMALVLNGERVRRDWTRHVALFGHALIGPVQGLTSQARELGRIVTKALGETDEVKKLKRRVVEEARVIRIWRELRRLYQSMKPAVQLRRQPLKPVVQRCFDRYHDSPDTRNVQYELRWPGGGELVFPFDEFAIDLALSNLLDNAAKYAFYNREVIVGVNSLEHVVRIWVEDVGHGIPKEKEKEIYKAGERLRQYDPFRIIPGQGIGLPMALAFVEAHKGRLYHTSRLAGVERGAKTPSRVRFTIELPTQWGIH